MLSENAHVINLYGALGVEKLSHMVSTSILGSEIVTGQISVHNDVMEEVTHEYIYFFLTAQYF